MLQVGRKYSKEELYTLLKIPPQKQKGSWNTGYVRYNGDIYLFVNIGIAGRTGHNYANNWDGANLVWFGKTGTHKNQPLIRGMINNASNVFIFTRTENRAPFVYNGVGKCLSHEDTSPIKITWNIQAIGKINAKHLIVDPEKAWILFRQNTSLAKASGETFFSPVNQEKYLINEVQDQKVVIERSSTSRNGPQSNLSSFTYSAFSQIIKKINASGGNLPKKLLNVPAIIQASFVWFLPMLDWDETDTCIIYSPLDELLASGGSSTNIIEAKDDQVTQIILASKRVRHGQNKLKRNLLALYNNQCCITACTVKEVLNACHIEAHHVKGYNSTTNALLLRSDIHDLWDANLIGINPETLIIHIREELHNTHYAWLENRALSPRIDNVKLDTYALEAKWKKFANFR